MNIETLIGYNDAYRAGDALISDAEYDALHSRLKAAHPDHPFFAAPEPSPVAGDRIRHLHPMLSTDKAYTSEEVAAWAASVSEAAGAPASSIMIRVTPKLDGIAAFYSNKGYAYTRGDGGYGSNLLPLFERGHIGGCPEGEKAGEIVVAKQYFDEVLAEEFDLTHPRNFVAGFVAAETLEAYHLRAIEDDAVRFVAYDDMNGIICQLSELAGSWEKLYDSLTDTCPYLCDGLVVDVTDPALREKLGSTSHHHRWQIALKRNDPPVSATVKAIRYTTGRTGRICPTAELSPVSLYGVTITWATAHNHKRLMDWGIGPGAKVEVVRSGGVIPKIQIVTDPVVVFPEMNCPSCGTPAEMRGPTAFCPNTLSCPAQAAARLQHFFKTIGTCKGFGPSVCVSLAAAGYTQPFAVFTMGTDEMRDAGISPGIASNLREELRETLKRPVSEAYFLAAMGIPNLGRGDSRKLLECHALETLGGITAEQIAEIHGFAIKTATSIARDLNDLWPQISALLSLGWTFDRVKNVAAADGPLAGKIIVFTGAMSRSREAMEAEARNLGATVGGSVSAKTTLLVCGDKVGAAKTTKAEKLGVRVITEAEYLGMIA